MGLGEWGRPAAYKAAGRGPRGDANVHPASGIRDPRAGGATWEESK